jgi:hypothetical protein
MTSNKKTTRRSAFDSWQNGQQSDTEIVPPPSPLDQMSVAAPRKRSRSWEKEHRTCSYRGVPQELHDQVAALAFHLHVNTDEVVQVFMQYGLSCFDKGILTISPRPKAQRMTLFPLPFGSSEQAGWSEADKWEPGRPKEIPTKRKTGHMVKKQVLWKRVVTYRLDNDSSARISYLAGQHTLPVGEIVTLFLKHGLESYKNGHLNLNPQPKMVVMTLSEGVS